MIDEDFPAQPPVAPTRLDPVEPGWPQDTIEVQVSESAKREFQSYPGKVEVRVRPLGLKKTHRSVIQRQINTIEEQTTVMGILDAVSEAKNRWLEMDCFSDVTFEGFAPSAEGGAKLIADVRFREGENMSLGVFTDAERMVPEVKFNKNHLFGRAYSAYVEIQPAKTVGISIPASQEGIGPVSRLLRSRCPTMDYLVERGVGGVLSAMSFFRVGLKSNNPWIGSWSEYSASRLKETHTRNVASEEWVFDVGAQMGFGRSVRHTLRLATQQRELRVKPDTTISPELAAALKPSLRPCEVNLLQWDAVMDRRSYHGNPQLRHLYPHPVSGWLVQSSVKASGGFIGLAGRVSQLRGEVKGQWNHPLHPYLSLQLNGKLGALVGTESLLSDRFYMESESVRGFVRVGKKLPGDGGLAGGSLVGALSASLNFPLAVPIIPQGMLGGHVFLNAGGVGFPEEAGPGQRGYLSRALNGIIAGGAASCGAGLVLTALPILGSMGRLEVNFSYPLSHAPRDDFRQLKLGLQWAS